MSTSNVESDEDRRQKILDERFAQKADEQRREREEKQKEEQQQQTLVPKLRSIDEEAEEDRGVVFDKKKFPPISEAEYRRYWDNIGAQRSAYLTQLAKNTTFSIPLYTSKNSILDDPDKDLTDADQVDEMGIENKEFRFHDATTAQWDIIQELDYDINNARDMARQIAESAVKNKTPIPKEELEQLKETLREKDRKKYRYCAKIFFRMTGDQIDRADQRRLKDAVDAAIHRTIATIPNYSKISNQPFT